MPPRPVLKVRQGRPVSAVYIGKGPNPQDPAQSASYNSFLDGAPPALPDLPEPPSPTSSAGSIKSGLPSPPATNSTGSGSTGDPATIAIRERPLSLHSNSSASTSSGSHYAVATPMKRSVNGNPSSRSSSRLGDIKIEDSGFDDDFDKEHDKGNENNGDGDDTARLDRRLLSISNDDDKPKSSSENLLALQRVKSLAQRNRMALDKLSRLGSPSPARSGTPNSRSPAPSNASASSSRVSHSSRTRPLPQVPSRGQDHGRSGSETERESTHHSQTNSTHSQSSRSSSSHSPSIPSVHRSVSHSLTAHQRTKTPPPNVSPQQNPNGSPYSRMRHISAPASPQKARHVTSISGALPSGSNPNSKTPHSPSNHRRNRLSMATMAHLQLTDFEEEEGEDEPELKTATGTARERTRDRTLSERDLITQSALAAVASSRRSPLGNRRRSALPKEFRSDLTEDNSSPSGADYGDTGRKSVGGRYETRRGSPDDRRASWKTSTNVEPVTPFRSTADSSDYRRSSTVRERRTSGDHRSSSRTSATRYSPDDGFVRRERAQSLRTGSAESALGMWSPGGRSLLGEGLRAAGISRRKDDEPRGGMSNAGGRSDDVFREQGRRSDWSPQEILDDGRRRVFVERERDSGAPQRASTSMSRYQYLDREDPEKLRGGRSPALRGHRSSYSLAEKDHEQTLPRLERDSLTVDRAPSAMGRSSNGSHAPTTTSTAPLLAVAHLQERLSTASPFGTRRYSPLPPQAVTPQSEHARLMLESLAMFETSLSKIPRSASSTTNAGAGSSQADLSQNAQGMVHAADRLYGMLKQGGALAMEAQVEAEVESASRDPHVKDVIDLWGKVAADYREGSRTADDLIRGITGLLLGMGRVVRELMADRGSTDFGSPSVHGRHVSLGADEMRRASPDVGRHFSEGEGRGESSSGRQSVASRNSWEPSPREKEREREDTLKRLAGGSNQHRPDSVLARASPSTFQKLRDRPTQQLETPPSHGTNPRNSLPQAGPSVGGVGSTRRLFTPREQREQAHESKAAGSSGRVGTGLHTHDSQETVQPSPTPASRQSLDRSRTLPPLAIPKPLHVLPSEAAVRRQGSLKVTTNDTQNSSRERERRRTTLRGSDRPTFPSIASPSNPTTALTTHTVSNSHQRAFPSLRRTESDVSNPVELVTFSRPTTVSVSMKLSDLQNKHAEGERNRTASTAEDADRNVAQNALKSPLSGSETERDVRKQGVNVKKATVRMSLDSQRDDYVDQGNDTRARDVHAADRSAATTLLQQSGAGRRERRRTVTEIWPR